MVTKNLLSFSVKSVMECTGKKLACLKVGKRLLRSLACWTNFFHFHQMGFSRICFYEEKQKIIARATRANHKTAASLTIYLLFGQKRALHLTRLV